MADRTRVFASAFLCEKILTEKSGSGHDIHSPIRIVDTFTLAIPENLPQIDKVISGLAINLFIILKSEIARDGEVSLVLENPDGKTLGKFGPFKVSLRGQGHGHYIKVPVEVHAGGILSDGTYWFNVFWEEELIQRAPMTLKRTVVPQEFGSPNPKQTLEQSAPQGE
jgi:hypothetical protein